MVFPASSHPAALPRSDSIRFPPASAYGADGSGDSGDVHIWWQPRSGFGVIKHGGFGGKIPKWI